MLLQLKIVNLQGFSLFASRYCFDLMGCHRCDKICHQMTSPEIRRVIEMTANISIVDKKMEYILPFGTETGI